MKRIVFLVFSCFFIFSLGACSKEQIWVEKIDGTWRLQEKSVGGQVQENIDKVTFTFSSCNQNKEDRCAGEMSIEYAENGSIAHAPMEYTISWSKNLFIYFKTELPFQNMIYEIQTFKKNVLVLTYYDRAYNYDLVSLTFHRD